MKRKAFKHPEIKGYYNIASDMKRNYKHVKFDNFCDGSVAESVITLFLYMILAIVSGGAFILSTMELIFNNI